MKHWLRKRLEALMDNLISVGAVALVAATVAAIVSVGSDRVALRGWVVIVLVVVLVGLAAGLGYVFRRLRRLERCPPPPHLIVAPAPAPAAEPPKPKHAALLARIDALATQLPVDGATARWYAAEAFNGILTQIKEAVGASSPSVWAFQAIPQHSNHAEFADAENAQLVMLIQQLRAIVEHDETPP